MLFFQTFHSLTLKHLKHSAALLQQRCWGGIWSDLIGSGQCHHIVIQILIGAWKWMTPESIPVVSVDVKCRCF